MVRQVVAFIVSILIAYIPAAIGNRTPANEWYDGLDKPPLNPPGWLFGGVWTPLYFAMGVALFLIWRSDVENKQSAYVLFAVQAVLNAAWSLVCFGMEQLWLALVVIVALLVVIIICIRSFRRISKWASWLFVPYAAWVAFATYLNLGVAWLN